MNLKAFLTRIKFTRDSPQRDDVSDLRWEAMLKRYDKGLAQTDFDFAISQDKDYWEFRRRYY